MQDSPEHLIEYEGPAFLGESYLGGYFRLIRPGHHDREVAFRLSEHALRDLCEREGWQVSELLGERLLVAWARYEIEKELRTQGRVNPILVGATSDLELHPDLIDVLRQSAAEPPVSEPAPEVPPSDAHPEPAAAFH